MKLAVWPAWAAAVLLWGACGQEAATACEPVTEAAPFAYDGGHCGDRVREGFHRVGSRDGLAKLAGYTHLDGFLIIDDVGPDDLTDLRGLEELRCISGDLTIRGARGVQGLDGLEALRQIGGNLTIGDLGAGNSALTGVGALVSLTAVGGHLWVQDNPRLANLDGLSALTTVGGYVGVVGNPALEDARALSGLRNVGGGLNVADNASLPTCEARALGERLRDACVPTCVRGNMADGCAHAVQDCWYSGGAPR